MREKLQQLIQEFLDDTRNIRTESEQWEDGSVTTLERNPEFQEFINWLM